MGLHGPLSGDGQLRLQAISLLPLPTGIMESLHHHGPNLLILPLDRLATIHDVLDQPLNLYRLCNQKQEGKNERGREEAELKKGQGTRKDLREKLPQ